MSGEPWSKAELATLRELFPAAGHKELVGALPGRNLSSIRQKARVESVERAINKRTRWTAAEEGVLRRIYATAEQNKILSALPGRVWPSIMKKAADLRIRRPQPATRLNRRAVHPVIRQLRAEREERRMTRPELSRLVGYHLNNILAWELGKTRPLFAYVCDWAKAFGLELVLRPTAERLLSDGAARPSRERLMAGRA